MEQDTDEDVIERMDLPEGALKKFFDIGSIHNTNLNYPTEKCKMIWVKFPTISKLVSTIFYLEIFTSGADLLETIERVSHGVVKPDDVLLRVVGSASTIYPYESILILLMEEILHQLIWRIYHYFSGFVHLKWCRISSINSMMMVTMMDFFILRNASPKSPDRETLSTSD